MNDLLLPLAFRIRKIAGLYVEKATPCACYGLLVEFCTFQFFLRQASFSARFPYLKCSETFADITEFVWYGHILAMHILQVHPVELVPFRNSLCKNDGNVIVRAFQ